MSTDSERAGPRVVPLAAVPPDALPDALRLLGLAAAAGCSTRPVWLGGLPVDGLPAASHVDLPVDLLRVGWSLTVASPDGTVSRMVWREQGLDPAAACEQLAEWAVRIGDVHPYWVEEARLQAPEAPAQLRRLAQLCAEHGLVARLDAATDTDSFELRFEPPALVQTLARLAAQGDTRRWWIEPWHDAGACERLESRDRAGRPRPAGAPERDRLLATLERMAGDAVAVTLDADEALVAVEPMALPPSARMESRLALHRDGSLSARELLCGASAREVSELLHPGVEDGPSLPLLARGLPAGPGAVAGRVALDLASMRQIHRRGESAIYFVEDPSPEDIPAIVEAEAVVTARGGRTSHAAVLAQQLGRPCVVGCRSLRVDRVQRTVSGGDRVLNPGDSVTVDGHGGRVFVGSARIVEPAMSAPLAELLELADTHRRVAVRANADRASEARQAMAWGAEGIGLVRTEHMFLGTELVHEMRAIVLSSDESSRRRALDAIRPAQADVIGEMFRIVGDAPVTVRLLDPPLHEFLPANPDDIDSVAERLGMTVERVRREVSHLRESNPMLGRRGVRVGVTAPAIYDVQMEGIIDAIEENLRVGGRPRCEILVPFVVGPSEMRHFRARIEAQLERRGHLVRAHVRVGAMIELPRACLLAGEIARWADFLSFGTNDLTQTTFGFSRDDTAGFLPAYLGAELLDADPFDELDTSGVGELIEIACARARAARPEITLGICGEHASRAGALRWLHERPIDYVSCSPWRVPEARIGAAQAALLCDGSSAGGACSGQVSPGAGAPGAGAAGAPD